TSTTIPVAVADDSDATDQADKTEEAASEANEQSEPEKNAEAKVTEQIEDFIANNPTLTTSADLAPAENSSPPADSVEPKPAPASNDDTTPAEPVTTGPEQTDADKTMANAIDTLSKPDQESKPSSDEPTPPAPAAAKDTADTGSDSMTHGNRIIQPLADP